MLNADKKYIVREYVFVNGQEVLVDVFNYTPEAEGVLLPTVALQPGRNTGYIHDPSIQFAFDIVEGSVPEIGKDWARIDNGAGLTTYRDFSIDALVRLRGYFAQGPGSRTSTEYRDGKTHFGVDGSWTATSPAPMVHEYTVNLFKAFGFAVTKVSIVPTVNPNEQVGYISVDGYYM